MKISKFIKVNKLRIIFSLKNTYNSTFRKKLIIAIIKDYIIMQLCHWFYDNKSIVIDFNNEKTLHYKTIIGEVKTGINYYSKANKKYCINRNPKIIEKALVELDADRYLGHDAMLSDNVIVYKKGLAHHFNEKSFESDYRKDKRECFALWIAISSFMISIIGIIIALTIKSF